MVKVLYSNFKRLFCVFRLDETAASCLIIAFTSESFLYRFKDFKKALLWELNFLDSLSFVRVINQQSTAIKASNFENFSDGINQTHVIDRPGQIYMTKVSWTIDHVSEAGETCLISLHDSHSWVIDRVQIWRKSKLVVNALGSYVRYGHAQDFLLIKESELHCFNLFLFYVRMVCISIGSIHLK